ncbi:hypothetical protein [Bacillus sp. P14.5]|uniref:hypothetical protein n=1 Tax=Bacillus sp. P14.5 TaxID=1983400 RepID=UPI000DEA5BDD|nr:hypothetical protein [Bacillus sp. P14.5]
MTLNKEFIDYIHSLQNGEEFKEAKLVFKSKEDIAEAVSHKRVILQCLDIVLGTMEYRLNEKNKIISYLIIIFTFIITKKYNNFIVKKLEM